MNSFLLTRGYTLLRRDRILTVINLEDEIPDVLVEFVPLEELPADDVEIIEGDEEGVLRHHSLGPVEIKRDDDGRLTGVA